MGKRKRKRTLKAELLRFLSSEEGKIARGDALKAAALLGLLGGTLAAVESEALAQHSNYLHNSGGAPGAHYSHGSHASHASHGSHGSHGSHASHGSHGSGT